MVNLFPLYWETATIILLIDHTAELILHVFIFGKIIGGLFGLLLWGPFGGLIGIAIGHYFDKGLRSNWQSHAGVFWKQRRDIQQIFFTATFMVMGHLAKCDGRISEYEIQAAQAVMNRMGLSLEQRRQARDLFNQGKQSNFEIDPVLRELYTRCNSRQLLQMFINIQLQAAYADGALTQKERDLLAHICTCLGFSRIDYSQFERFYTHAYSHDEANSHHNAHHRHHATHQGHLSSAYATLGVPDTATLAEIKRAYRRQMSENHPDKLVSKGLPETMIKLATEKTQQIQEAYDTIKKSRS